MNLYKKMLCLLLVLGVSACGDDFLELTPNEAVAIGDAIKNVDDMETGVLGAYDGMQSANYYGRYFYLVPDVMSDDVKQNASANRAKEYAEFEAFPDHFITQNMWSTIYNVILRANTVINAEVEVAPALQDERDQLVGEAYAIRGLAFFDLVRIYGQHYGFTADNGHAGIPIVLTFDQDAEPARNTVGEVYTQVVSDLQQAITLMNDDKGSGFFSKGAAQALSARVSLYMSDYGKAESLASEVINSGSFTLTPTESYVSTWMEIGASPDAILDVVMNETDNMGSDALGRMYINEGYGDYLPSQDLVGLIDSNDVRSQLFKEDETIGGIYGNIRVNKFPSTKGEDNTPIIRLSEVYLIRAEARARTGNEAGAIEDLMTIRLRGNPNADMVTASGADLLAEIRLEKRIELMFEGQRLWDLMRNQEGITRIDCTAPETACGVNYPNDRFILPIPENETDANPNMAQNPGY